ncbi:MAG: hypothetical protein RL532_1101 [Actinomycetota bacterium]
MKISMMMSYAGGFVEGAARVVELESAGLDVVWIPEAYSFDAISQVGYLAAVTKRVEIGTGIINVYSRTAPLTAMTAAGCDYVSNGRFILGLGASGPQVVEGFHGVPYEKPMQRIKEYIARSHLPMTVRLCKCRCQQEKVLGLVSRSKSSTVPCVLIFRCGGRRSKD